MRARARVCMCVCRGGGGGEPTVHFILKTMFI